MTSEQSDLVSGLLKALGFSAPGVGAPALAALHAGAAHHRLAVIGDVMAAYWRDEPAEMPSYMREIITAREASRVAARRYYREALRFNPDLAEGWFNLGRLLQDEGNGQSAFVAFNRCAALSPHPDASPHAHLQANAHWHAATILEDQGRDAEALERYRQAVALCDNFGVHHARFANLLRSAGHIDEAMEHYQRLMSYSHRYFTEFVLPPLASQPEVPQHEELDVIYETAEGSPVVFWNGQYFRVRCMDLPVTSGKLAGMPEADAQGFLDRLLRLASRPPTRAVSISNLE